MIYQKDDESRSTKKLLSRFSRIGFFGSAQTAYHDP